MIVYRHIRLDKNEPFYIGIGKTEKRAYTTKGRNKYWHNIVNKTDYRVDIVFDDLSEDQAKEKEKEFIALYGRKDLGQGTLVNMTDGGDGRINAVLSEETKRKIGASNSISMKGNTNGSFLRTDDYRNKISIANTGKRNGMFSKVPWNKGLTKETSEKVKSIGNKVSKALKGNIPWNKK